MIGIASITASLVILLSAFNGIEAMIEKLYSEFDSDITIRSNYGKTFLETQIDDKIFNQINGIEDFSRAVEETVILKKEDKWVNAQIYGVDTNYLSMIHADQHLVDGEAFLYKNEIPFGIIGATLLDKINGYIPKNSYESIIIYAPKRDLKMKLNSNPFKTQNLLLSGRVNYNKEVNQQSLIVPLGIAKEILNYKNDLTAYYINVKEKTKTNQIKKQLQKKLGDSFLVKTNYEKNEVIFQTSKTEKLIVIAIMIFIFLLAAFNLVASITMLFIEKKDNIFTLKSFGASNKTIFNIFFYEGLLISIKGMFIGLLIGYTICIAQFYGKFIKMPDSLNETFPIQMKFSDALLIVSLVLSLSLFVSYFPVKLLLRKEYGKDSYQNEKS